MTELKIRKPGELVRVTYEGRTVSAMVGLASPFGNSLILVFQAMLGGYIGTMPVLWDEESSKFRDLIEGKPVTIKDAK